MYKYIHILITILACSGCFSSISNKRPELPQNLSLYSVSFGKITKEKVGKSFVRTDYPCQVFLVINGLDSLANSFSGENNGLYIDQNIVTKDGSKWHYEAYMPFAAMPDFGKTNGFNCNIYDPYDDTAPKQKMIKGNIKSYSYNVYLTYMHERKKLFSGEEDNL